MSERSARDQYKKFLDHGFGVDDYNKLKHQMYGRPDRLVESVFAILWPRIKTYQSIRVLDVGGGDGRRLRHFMQLCRRQGVVVAATLVDPSIDFMRAAKRNVPGVKCIQSTAEDFTSRDQFDFVLMLHSIYGISHQRYARRVWRLVAPGGTVCIVANTPSAFLWRLKQISDLRYKQARRDLATVIRDFRFTKVKPRRRVFTNVISGVVRQQQLTTWGKKLVAWMCMTPWSATDSQTQQAATQLLMTASRGRDVVTDRDTVLLYIRPR